jgi:hypothetical protein
MENNGLEVAGEDYYCNKQKDKEDAYLYYITSCLIDLCEDVRIHDNSISKDKFKEFVVKALKEI